jgi:hypothetical protein
MAKLFGFEITRLGTDDSGSTPSFVAPSNDDGSIDIREGGVLGQYVDLDGKAKNDEDLINRYREMAMQPECETAIDDIVNEAVVQEDKESPVTINLDNLDYGAGVKKRISEEFDSVLRLLDFSNYGPDIFKRWYVDGRINYHNVIDVDNPKEGLKELRYIDPRQIKKVRKVKTEKDGDTNISLYKEFEEYFIYNENGLSETEQGIKIARDSITYVTSGMLDKDGKQVLSYLHKAIKPLNQLRAVEDAVVIYRLSRAPERRIFYVDVGNLPKGKAEQYLRDIMSRYKNKIVYNASTGEINDDRKHMSMLEDFWMPRREGGRGTEVATLSGGQNLGEMEDVNYFKSKLYKSLNVPASRLDGEQSFSMGRGEEITRDEIKFNKFIKKLRIRFTHLFDDLLKKQLILKGVIAPEDWDEIKDSIFYDFRADTHFAELKNQEILRERIGLLGEMDQYVGKYFSRQQVLRDVLKLSDAEIEDLEATIKKETEDGKIGNEDDGGYY